MKRVTKRRISNLIGTLFFALLVFVGTYSMFSNVTVEMSELENFKGVVDKKGITANNNSISGKGNVTSNIFYLKLDGLDQILAIYNMSQNYQSVDSRLNIGDTVSVYYKSSTNNSKPNLKLYQIERNGTVLFDNKEFRTRESKGLFVAVIGLIVIITIGIIQDRRLRLGKI